MSNYSTPHRKSPEAVLLLTLGLLATASGLALAVLPDLVPSLAKVVTAIQGLGLQTGVLVTGGMTLVGMGVLARAIYEPAPAAHPIEPPVDPTAALESLHRELVDLRNATHRLAESAPAAAEPAQGGLPHEQLDALFRIAASLDQFTAKIDLGLKAEITAMRAEVRELRQGLGSVEAILARVTSRPSAPAPAGAAPMPARPMAPAPRPDLSATASTQRPMASAPRDLTSTATTPRSVAGAPPPRPRPSPDAPMGTRPQAEPPAPAPRRPLDQGAPRAGGPSAMGGFGGGASGRPSGSGSLDLKNDSNGR
jgi:hypothetical protein